MKKLSDYKGEQAIELWAELIEPLTAVLADKEVAASFQSNKSVLSIAKTVLKLHPKEISDILLTIDDTPLNGLNVVIRFVDLLNELQTNDDVKSFFGFAGQEKEQSKSFGSATENTEDAEN